MVHHRLIVDTDPGLDDALALQYLTRHPAVELLGVGSVHGNVPAHAAANNALRLLELVDDTETPVVVGSEEPLAQPLQLGQPSDEFGALAGAPRRRPAEASAADLIVQTARAMPGEVSLLALGPLTNVALALLKEPDLPRLLNRVVMMGGAIADPGNAAAFAEKNVAHDPEAAESVIAAGFELTMVGLDVTRSAIASPTWVRAVAADPLWGAFARHVLTQYGDDLPPLPLHDPLTAAILIDPHLATYEHQRVRVVLDGPERGRTVVDGGSGGGSAAVATTANVDVAFQRLLQVLVPQGHTEPL